jgi:hypothetical protein
VAAKAGRTTAFRPPAPRQSFSHSRTHSLNLPPSRHLNFTCLYSTKLYLNNAPRMAHLLTIPREIRDLIYGYLTQERNLYLERERCY